MRRTNQTRVVRSLRQVRCEVGVASNTDSANAGLAPQICEAPACVLHAQAWQRSALVVTVTMRGKVRILPPSDCKPTLAKLFVCALKLPTRLDQMLHLIPGRSTSKLTVVGRSQTDGSHFFGPFSIVVTTAARGAELPLPQVTHLVRKCGQHELIAARLEEQRVQYDHGNSVPLPSF